MAKTGGEYTMEILGAVLADNAVTIDQIRELVRRRPPEGLYLEYKRGLWVGEERSKSLTLAEEFRRYAHGFANAEGGLFIVGIVGGEDSQGPEKWSIEGASAPDSAGWVAWLSKVLQEASVRTRVRFQIIETDEKGKEIVLVAVERAESLIRAYVKPHLICYLRIGDQTVAIDDTLYADLVLGRRVKPDLEFVPGAAEVNRDSTGIYLNARFEVRNNGLVWVPDMKAAWLGFIAASGIRSSRAVSEALERQVEVRLPTATASDGLTVRLSTGEIRRHSETRELAPFEAAEFGMKLLHFPVPQLAGPWVWGGALMITPKNSSPLCAQVIVDSREGFGFAKADIVVLRKEVRPLVTWLRGSEVIGGISEIFRVQLGLS
jgi:hypothetical protein